MSPQMADERIAQLVRDVCDRLDANGMLTSEFSTALSTEIKARKRRAKFLATHSECMRLGLADLNLPLTRVGLFGEVAGMAELDLTPEAAERHYYTALCEYGGASLLAERLNTEN